jgi:hypothetical protein
MRSEIATRRGLLGRREPVGATNVSMREREGLVARVKQMRRASPAGDRSAPAERAPQDAAQGAGHGLTLELRVAHLERLLEGLQDSVHRESQRQDRRISDLEARLEPSALAVELSKNARERGL